jgi:PAS domain S-box-containing protein
MPPQAGTPLLNDGLSLAHPLWRDRLALLLESTGEGMFGVNLDGRCIFINAAGARMLGYEPAEVIGRNMHELIHHTRADGQPYPESDCPIFNAFRQGQSCRIDNEVLWRRDGTSFPAEYTSHPVVDNGQVMGAMATIVDITPRKLAADALRRAKEELEVRVEERTRELSEALSQVRKLSAWLDSVREDERTRIAREVHDELGSLLVALKMDVNWLAKRLGETPAPQEADAQRERLRCKCHNMSRLIENAVENVGRIITDLRPSILDHQGLWAALEWQAQEFVQSAELELDWLMDVAPGVELPEPAAMAVFRIFQEMLSNVGRHAQASAVAIHIAADARQLRLSVRDNGRGAPPEAFEAPTAYGVMGMRERALHFGGQVSIDSRPGQGVTFALLLPVAA